MQVGRKWPQAGCVTSRKTALRFTRVAVEAMNEVGIDISNEFPKPFDTEAVKAADAVITMGCGDTCPIFPGKRYEDWVLEDPAGLGVDAVRPIRDEIRRRVVELLNDLGIETK
jgi:protein-tyrosine-phosphatase